jgi:hypothetical protein
MRVLTIAALCAVIATPARAEVVCQAVYKIMGAGAESPRFRSLYGEVKDFEAVGSVRIGGLQDCTVSTLSFSPIYMCSSPRPIPAEAAEKIKAELDRRLTACLEMPGELNRDSTGPVQTMWKVRLPGVNPRVSTRIRDGHIDLLVRVDPVR